MKKINKIFAISAVALTAGVALQSCQSEAPFSADGEGLVRLNVDVNSKLTRAVEGEEALRANARIYISNEKGVLNKWVGTQSIPKDGVYLRYGSYVAEAMAGDSASASFTKKYFKGATAFSLSGSEPMANVTISCRIANVVVSLEESTIDSKLMQDLKVKIGNSRGELTYYADSLYNRGYFMMPNADKSLNYTVTGVNSKGHAFTKSGVIEDVKPSTHYRLNFEYTTPGVDQGGAFFTISISEESLIEEEVTIYGKPAFSWINNNPAVDAQIIGSAGSFTDSRTLRVAAYRGFKSLLLKTEDADLAGILGGNEFELVGITETGRNNLDNKGVSFVVSEPKDELYRQFIQFSPIFLNSLPARDTEYVLTVVATDNNNKRAESLVRIANTDAAIVYADPIIIEFEDFSKDFTSVSAKSATIPVNITDANVENPAIQYRKSGETAWTTVPVTSSRASGAVMVKLTGLTPATTYQFRVVAGALNEGAYDFESDELGEFTTEGVFTIPNASFEDWGSYRANTALGEKDVVLPFAGSDKLAAFWGSGNEGSATANMTLTNKYTELSHSGSASARLASNKAFGVLAAGNLFVGNYKETYETSNGKLSFGREYNGSHPSKLRLWANYRPGTVDVIKKGMDSFVPSGFKGSSDQGQIYVALTTGPVEVKTGSDRKLFSPEPDGNSDARVVGYGQVTWNSNYGADGSLDMLEIPIEYTSIAKTVKPTHLVIVCSASKFGDYFCGSSSSVMVVDDFELIYE
jgi:hypothetical protein